MTNLILTSRSRLLARYGEVGLHGIAAQAETLRQHWQQQQPASPALFLYLDDAASLLPYKLRPANASKPATIRKLLGEIEVAVGQIDHLLLLGGPQVIPWWHLESPVFDVDAEVLSDNPYGCRAEGDYLVPERRVGRMPDAEGASGADASPLLAALQVAIKARPPLLATAKSLPQAVAVGPRGCGFLSLRRNEEQPADYQPSPATYPSRTVAAAVTDPSFAYSTAVWESVSRLIYRTVQGGGAGSFLVSPPTNASSFSPVLLQGARFIYFNLHGVIDRPQWFGQSRDLAFASPDNYPDALHPEQLAAVGESIRAIAPFVFSEACYGAYIDGKRTAEAICLQLLSLGVSCFVGSTVTSYGRSDPPLSEADLLTDLFFRHLYAGESSGQALTSAKNEYAAQMLGRFRALDDDDRKTLLEFVLYGDPLLKAF